MTGFTDKLGLLKLKLPVLKKSQYVKGPDPIHPEDEVLKQRDNFTILF
jgi:hypothetical protein